MRAEYVDTSESVHIYSNAQLSAKFNDRGGQQLHGCFNEKGGHKGRPRLSLARDDCPVFSGVVGGSGSEQSPIFRAESQILTNPDGLRAFYLANS